MKNVKNKRCYYCNGPAQSGEHVPPKLMFKGFDCDGITVPACNEHNTKKSGADQAIISAMLIPLHTGRDRHPVNPDVEKAIQAALSSFERTKRSAIQTPLLINPQPGQEDFPNLAFLIPPIDLSMWIRQVSAGIIYDGIGSSSMTISWANSTTWSPDWYHSKAPAPIEPTDIEKPLIERKRQQVQLDNLEWVSGWSAEPRPYPSTIYSFAIHLTGKKENIIRHRFYDSYTWYVKFFSSARNIIKLKERLCS